MISWNSIFVPLTVLITHLSELIFFCLLRQDAMFPSLDFLFDILINSSIFLTCHSIHVPRSSSWCPLAPVQKRRLDFLLWETFLQISGVTKVLSKFSKFFGGNISIKTPHRRSFIFSSFLWMWGSLSSWHSNSWIKSYNNSSSSSSLSPFPLEFSPVSPHYSYFSQSLAM